ncbi:hypothetical protein E8E12_004985 [Didymella heteroderae]|uniref:DUF4470 domain-containing protein n=1 Tax=Didymella heteroderae TaxID=1769908 RepID=A0A9P4WJD3_9PLEO|nr:hypothetical protein E8E12_004985 [Didymella heteroderae]
MKSFITFPPRVTESLLKTEAPNVRMMPEVPVAGAVSYSIALQNVKKQTGRVTEQPSWMPTWHHAGRTPQHYLTGPPAEFSLMRYLWGTHPALDVLNLANNEGENSRERHFDLLFPACGDLRNVIKTLLGLPQQYQGKCCVIINDKDFQVVARNVIMLLVAHHLESDIAVPLIIHLWYSAFIPAVMLYTLQSSILPLIAGVCDKIKNKADDSLQAKTYKCRNRELHLVFTKEQWMALPKYFEVPEDLSREKAQAIRHNRYFAPEMLDFRERMFTIWTPPVRQGEMHFRETGLLLPQSTSQVAFDTPNPTLFQSASWSLYNSASPRDGWSAAEYRKYATAAKDDDFGALYFYLIDNLGQFCNRLHTDDIAIKMFSVDAYDASNICDNVFLGTHRCLESFFTLLKPKSQNPHATLLLLYISAITETILSFPSPERIKRTDSQGVMRIKKYMPVSPDFVALVRHDVDKKKLISHPDYISGSGNANRLIDWDQLWDFYAQHLVYEAIDYYDLKIKDKHTIVEPWAFKAWPHATQKEFDDLRAGQTSGMERYLELERIE